MIWQPDFRTSPANQNFADLFQIKNDRIYVSSGLSGMALSSGQVTLTVSLADSAGMTKAEEVL